jgi:hypothetical protein
MVSGDSSLEYAKVNPPLRLSAVMMSGTLLSVLGTPVNLEMTSSHRQQARVDVRTPYPRMPLSEARTSTGTSEAPARCEQY